MNRLIICLALLTVSLPATAPYPTCTGEDCAPPCICTPPPPPCPQAGPPWC